MGVGNGIASIDMTSSAIARTVRSQPVVVGAAGLVLAVLAVLAVAVVRDRGSDGTVGEVVAGQVPRFEAETLDGATFRIADYDDRPMLIYFWASWCLPCRAEAPAIERLWSEYEAKGYTFVGMNIWDTEADAKKFAREFDLSFPLVRDPENKVYLDFGVETLPMAFIVRPGLEIDRKYLGELTEGDLRTMLDSIGGAS